MRGNIITIVLILAVVGLIVAVDYASRSHDRAVKALWDAEEAGIRAKEIARKPATPPIVSPFLEMPRPAPAPVPAPRLQPGQRDT